MGHGTELPARQGETPQKVERQTDSPKLSVQTAVMESPGLTDGQGGTEVTVVHHLHSRRVHFEQSVTTLSTDMEIKEKQHVGHLTVNHEGDGQSKLPSCLGLPEKYAGGASGRQTWFIT